MRFGLSFHSSVPAAVMVLTLATTPTCGRSQVPSTHTQPPDTLRPIALAPLEVTILLSPLQARESPHAVSVARDFGTAVGDRTVFLEGALRALPGLQIQNRFNLAVGERVSVRGIGGRAQFGVRGLRIDVDGIPATLPDGQATLDHLDLATLGRAELLRGPASSLYGNGAGAVLHLQTRAPSELPLEERISLSAGSHGLLQATSVTSGTSGRTGYLLSLGLVDYDGYRGDPQTGVDRFGSAQRRGLNGRVERELAGGRGAAVLNIVTLDAENPGSLTRSLIEGESREARGFNVTQQTGKELDQAQIGLSWVGPLNRLTAALAGFGVQRDVWNPIPPSIVDLERKAAGVRGSLQGRITSGAARLRWTAGGDLGAQWDNRRNFENQEGTPGATTLDQEEKVLGARVFVQGHIRVLGRLDLLTGLRFDRTAFEVEDRYREANDPDDSGRRVMRAWSPSLAIAAPLRPGLTARGGVSTFFQTPTTSELANQAQGAGGFNPALDPQQGTTVEAGLTAFLGGTVVAEATWFHTGLRKELVPFEVSEAPGRVYYRNAGRSRYRGLELGVRSLLGRGLQLRSAYTFLDASFREFLAEGEDLGGNRVPGTARHSFDGVLAWERVFPSRGFRAFIETSLRYRGAVLVDDRNSDQADPFTVLDLRMGFGDIGLFGAENTFFGGVTNVLDRYYVTSVSVNAFGGRFFEPGPPRALFLGAATTLGLRH